MPRTALAALFLLACSWPAQAQVPAGPEFRVNTYTTSNQEGQAVCSDGAGNFVVAWQSGLSGIGRVDVVAQRYDAAGVARGGEFRVTPPEDPLGGVHPAVACSARGGFVVAWQGVQADRSDPDVGILARRYDASGAARGAEFLVNSYTTGGQGDPAVASDGDGNFVVAWVSRDQDGSYYGIFAQRLDSSGQRRGGEFRVNTSTSFFQKDASVAAGPGGAFIVTWSSYDTPGLHYEIRAQRYDGSGEPLGGEFTVNTTQNDSQDSSSVAMASNGDFTVVWQSFVTDFGDSDVMGQRFDAAGQRKGGEFRVNTYTTGLQEDPRIAADGSGNLVVVWPSFGQIGQAQAREIYARRYDAAGNPRSGEFRVNTYTTDSQDKPVVAATQAGNFVVAWRSFQDGDGTDVYAQRFGGLTPVGLAVDTAGNHVLEPGETVDVRPSWRNVSGSAQTFAGGLSGLTGPAGATYTITDGTADYGTVANGATAPCADCYAVSVSNPATRPGTHWDATALESITPDAQGQRKVWRLHVGHSFTDVAGASAFYPFIETLLHQGITGGCSASAYCPATPTTRDQMAVFVLVAKEGAGFAPPSCTTPVFNDVPASSGFCRWVEELARRGVVAGCGGGNYCPADAVTREQMAVFVLRTLDPALSPPDCTTPVFGDVPAASPFCRWVEELARRGVVTGCGGGNYCPQAPVTREQMAVFIAATFSLTLYGA